MDADQILLLGISIDEGCDPHIRKCLQEGVVYPFYRFFKVPDSKYSGTRAAYPLSPDFFIGKGKTPLVSLSAIVGPNGSGKSTIIEVLLRLLNNTSFLIGQVFNHEHDFCLILGLRASLYYSIGNQLYKLSQTGDTKDDLTIEEFDSVSKTWIEMYKWKYALKDVFFYNVLLNYSLYAFNTHDLNDDRTSPPSVKGRWIDACFHKNDGYLAPVTLNPLRTNGNIDVNRERELAKSRLISLMFLMPGEESHSHADKNFPALNPFLYINDRYSLSYITMRLDSKGVKAKSDRVFGEWKVRYDKKDEDIAFVEDRIINAWETICGLNIDTGDNNIVVQTAVRYLVYKTISVANKYNAFDYFYALSPIYSGFKDYDEWNDKIYLLIREISKDRSHITFRLRQTLAFLKFRQYDITDAKKKRLSADKLSSILKGLDAHDLDEWNLEELAPPPIFDTEIWVSEKDSKDRFLLSRLSSGEIQLTYSMATILYHLRNIDSVPDGSMRRKKYKYVNVILDEIELYFHPEYQRLFVSRLLGCLRAYPFKTVLSINVMMATHSPFILSDIPKSNVLFLKYGNIDTSMQENTFAANIHSLLQNGFFLENGAIGEFAREKVNDFFRELHEDTDPNIDPNEIDDYIRIKNELLQNILLVSEPILRTQLLRLFNERYGAEMVLLKLREEIRSLRNEIDGLRK